MQRSVFDISKELFAISGKERLPALTLQKLTFFSFGWYAHLTGEKLFAETFYAMEHGPVVGELLTAHSGSIFVTPQVIEAAAVERADQSPDDDSYLRQVIKAVWDYYSQFDRWQLVEVSHDEDVWKASWDARPKGSKRGSLTSDEIVRHFLGKRSIPSGIRESLPDPQISYLTLDEFEKVESLPRDVFSPLKTRFKELGLVG